MSAARRITHPYRKTTTRQHTWDVWTLRGGHEHCAVCGLLRKWASKNNAPLYSADQGTTWTNLRPACGART